MLAFDWSINSIKRLRRKRYYPCRIHRTGVDFCADQYNKIKNSPGAVFIYIQRGLTLYRANENCMDRTRFPRRRGSLQGDATRRYQGKSLLREQGEERVAEREHVHCWYRVWCTMVASATPLQFPANGTRILIVCGVIVAASIMITSAEKRVHGK